MPQADVAAFRLTPDLRFLFLHEACETAFAALCQGIRRGDRLLLLTGPYGVGKTLLLRRIESQLAREGVPALYAAYPKLDLDELLAWCRSGAPAAAPSCVAMLDDADRCSTALLAALHARLGSAGSDLGVQLVLAGGPQLASRLADEFPRLHALARVHAQLTPLDSAEAGAYIRHRLDVLGKREVALASDAASDVFHYSQGIPRLINHACARALLLAGPEPSVVSQEITREAIEDYVANTSFGQTNVARFVPSQPIAAAVTAPAEPAPVAPLPPAEALQESPPQAAATRDESHAAAAPEPEAAPHLEAPSPPAAAETAPAIGTKDEPAPPLPAAPELQPLPVAPPEPVAAAVLLPPAVAEAAPSVAPTDLEVAIPAPPVQPRRVKEAPAVPRVRRPNQMLRTLARKADTAAPADRSGAPAKFSGFRTRRAATPRADLPRPQIELPPRANSALELWPLVAAAVVIAAVLAIPAFHSRLHWLDAIPIAELREAIGAAIADVHDALRDAATAIRRKIDDLI